MSTESSTSARRVLVAEDETLIRLDIVETLTEAGYEVVAEAADGEEAVRLAGEHEPDLCVMDVKMPVMDGITAAEQIIEKHGCAVVMLTAFSRHEEIASLESEIADLNERFETRKRVDRAKGLLMERMGLSEPEAFRWMQKTSMNRRLTMREVADAVIEQVGSTAKSGGKTAKAPKAGKSAKSEDADA